MFLDLNVLYPSSVAQAKQIAIQAIQLGYDGIVWNRTVTSKLQASDACNFTYPDVSEAWQLYGTSRNFHFDVSSPPASCPPSSSSFIQLSRLTLPISDLSQLHGLSNTNNIIMSYDLLAVKPMNEKVFHALCGHDNIDIIVVEVAEKLPFFFKKPSINLAHEHGIHFEFCYGSCLRDANTKRYLFSSFLHLHRLTSSSSSVFSSGAQRAAELRSPHDVCNLAIMCGMQPQHAKAAISSRVNTVIMHGESRKTVKCVLRVVEPVAQQQASNISSNNVDDDSMGTSNTSSTQQQQQKQHNNQNNKHNQQQQQQQSNKNNQQKGSQKKKNAK